MIQEHSVPSWPENVELLEDIIMDYDLELSHKINESSFFILKEIDGQKSLIEIVNLICDLYKWDKEQLLPDVIELFSFLNHNYLLNVSAPKLLDTQVLNYMKVLFKNLGVSILLFLYTIKGKKWYEINRYGLTSNFMIRYLKIFYFILKSYLPLYFIAFFIMYLIFEFVNVGGIFGLLVTLSIILGMTFHEWGHYFTYNYFEKKKSAFIVRKLGAIQIVRTSLYGKEDVVVSVMR